jgi:hypothetical protein
MSRGVDVDNGPHPSLKGTLPLAIKEGDVNNVAIGIRNLRLNQKRARRGNSRIR